VAEIDLLNASFQEERTKLTFCLQTVLKCPICLGILPFALASAIQSREICRSKLKGFVEVVHAQILPAPATVIGSPVLVDALLYLRAPVHLEPYGYGCFYALRLRN